MKWNALLLAAGCLLLVLSILHYARGKVDATTIKIGNGEIDIYLMPATVGAEYFPETYIDEAFRSGSWKYERMPFLATSSPEKASLKNYPQQLTGHFYWRYFFGGMPHLSIALAFPLWLPVLILSGSGLWLSVRRRHCRRNPEPKERPSS